jgi:hypothetical protein
VYPCWNRFSGFLAGKTAEAVQRLELALHTQLKQGVNEMRVVDLEIKDIAFGGKGVGRDQGKAIFVPYVIARKNSSPKGNWSRSSKTRRIV